MEKMFKEAEDLIVKTEDGVEIRMISDEVVMYKKLSKEELIDMLEVLGRELDSMK